MLLTHRHKSSGEWAYAERRRHYVQHTVEAHRQAPCPAEASGIPSALCFWQEPESKCLKPMSNMTSVKGQLKAVWHYMDVGTNECFGGY